MDGLGFRVEDLESKVWGLGEEKFADLSPSEILGFRVQGLVRS